MSDLRLTLKMRQAEDQGRYERFLSALALAIDSRAFSGVDPANGSNDEMAVDAARIKATGREVSLAMPLAQTNAVSARTLRQLFETRPDIHTSLPTPIVELQCSSIDSDVSALQRQRRAAGLVLLPTHFPDTDPVTVEIELAQPLPLDRRADWRQRLKALERCVSEAPFLTADAGQYASVGASQLVWRSDVLAHYTLEGVVSLLPWDSLFCNLLFAMPVVERPRRVAPLE